MTNQLSSREYKQQCFPSYYGTPVIRDHEFAKYHDKTKKLPNNLAAFLWESDGNGFQNWVTATDCSEYEAFCDYKASVRHNCMWLAEGFHPVKFNNKQYSHPVGWNESPISHLADTTKPIYVRQHHSKPCDVRGNTYWHKPRNPARTEICEKMYSYGGMWIEKIENINGWGERNHPTEWRISMHGRHDTLHQGWHARTLKDAKIFVDFKIMQIADFLLEHDQITEDGPISEGYLRGFASLLTASYPVKSTAQLYMWRHRHFTKTFCSEKTCPKPRKPRISASIYR